jgi:hypothetical protein
MGVWEWKSGGEWGGRRSGGAVFSPRAKRGDCSVAPVVASHREAILLLVPALSPRSPCPFSRLFACFAGTPLLLSSTPRVVPPPSSLRSARGRAVFDAPRRCRGRPPCLPNRAFSLNPHRTLPRWRTDSGRRRYVWCPPNLPARADAGTSVMRLSAPVGTQEAGAAVDARARGSGPSSFPFGGHGLGGGRSRSSSRNEGSHEATGHAKAPRGVPALVATRRRGATCLGAARCAHAA